MLITIHQPKFIKTTGEILGIYIGGDPLAGVGVPVAFLSKDYSRIIGDLDRDPLVELDIDADAHKTLHERWKEALQAKKARDASEPTAKREAELHHFGGDTPEPLQAGNDPGSKFDGTKPTFTLIAWDAIGGVQKVLDFGAKKYAPRNWEKGISYTRVCNATIRHVTDFLDGKDLDDETALSVIDHAMCELMFLSAYIKRGMTEFDDRPGVAGRFKKVGE